MLLKDKNGKVQLIDVVILLHSKVQKTSTKVTVHVNMTQEIKDMWRLTVVILKPTLTSATGKNAHILTQDLQKLKLNKRPSTKQKTA
jgi:hypothetical protein